MCRVGAVFLCLLLFAVATDVCLPQASAARFPWERHAKQPDDWFRGDEAARIAANVISHQSVPGSWPKNIDTGAEPYRGDAAKLHGTFDNGATRGEARFLARMFNQTKDPRYRHAVLKTLDHILAAQYPSGGWPQSSPPGTGYPRYITFNDDTMVGLMQLLREVASAEQFTFVDRPRRQQAQAAFDRGIQCILKCQVVADAQPTAWCAQHDEVTLQPRKGRAYEHPSVSGAESAGIVRLLMSVENPSPEVVRAVDGACRWYERAKLTGIRQVVRDGDKVIVPDPMAPPLWARFYEIGTNRPIFSGRDGVIKYNIAQIEPERRNGYAWYGDWGAKLLVEWASWRQAPPR